MNREIEFRAWDSKNKKMLYGVPLEKDGSVKVSISSGFAAQYDPQYECITDVMQFIGLLDKNGAKIFEGDLCQYFKNDLLLVEWHQPDAQFKLKRLNGIKEYLRFDCDVEVIGNQFENPELLEEK